MNNLVAMAQRVQNKTTFAPAKVIQPIYTRGSVVLSQDGRIIATCLDEDVLLTDLRTGEELARIEGVCVLRLFIDLWEFEMLTSCSGRRNSHYIGQYGSLPLPECQR
jgi:hypothetical protein